MVSPSLWHAYHFCFRVKFTHTVICNADKNTIGVCCKTSIIPVNIVLWFLCIMFMCVAITKKNEFKIKMIWYCCLQCYIFVHTYWINNACCFHNTHTVAVRRNHFWMIRLSTYTQSLINGKCDVSNTVFQMLYIRCDQPILFNATSRKLVLHFRSLHTEAIYHLWRTNYGGIF